MEIIIEKANLNTNEAKELICELSNELNYITGNNGRGSFDNSDMNNLRSLFVIARENRTAVGCGAFREFNSDTAEIKRMYARIKTRGIGNKILTYLEERAKEIGYKSTVLETRACNVNAVSFYLNNGYKIISNYGKYKNVPEAICFEKKL